MQKFHQTIIFIISCIIIFLLILWNNRRYNDYVQILKSEAHIFKSDSNATNKLFNLKLKYILNSKLCQNKSENYFAVFIVTSYFANIETRSSMRQAFSNNDLREMELKRVFLLGINENDPYVSEAAIINESERFGDIVQGNFIEAYRNLTYKHVMGLKWVSQHCSNVKYVIKMDDDIVVDVRQFVGLLKKLTLPSPNYIVGHILRGMSPIREPANKWYVTKEEYQQNYYPTFVSGWLYVTTPKVAWQLSSFANKNSYFWIDDVFITGILAQKLKIRHLNINRYFAVHSELMKCCLRDLPNLRCDYIIGPNGGDNEMFYNFNTLSAKCLSVKCPNRKKLLNKTCIVEKKENLNHGSSIIEPYKLS